MLADSRDPLAATAILALVACSGSRREHQPGHANRWNHRGLATPCQTLARFMGSRHAVESNP